MPSLANTLRRCHSTVRVLMNSSAAISGLVRPSRASRMMCSSCGVSWLWCRPRVCGPSRRWRAVPGARARRRLRRRSRRAGGRRRATGGGRRAAGSRDGATHRRAGGPGPARAAAGAAQPLDRLGVALLGLPAFADQRSRARLQALRPVGTLNGHGRQPAQRFSGQVRPSGSHGGLDQFRQNQLRAQGLSRSPRSPAPPRPAPLRSGRGRCGGPLRTSWPSGRRVPPREPSSPQWSP